MLCSIYLYALPINLTNGQNQKVTHNNLYRLYMSDFLALINLNV